VGAGAGAHGFVRSYRALNQEDEIVIFSKENLPFYNRVQLPGLYQRCATLGTACRMTDEEEGDVDIRLHRGVGIDKIDRVAKTVTDSTLRGDRL